jgi:hypothetical protein
MAGCGAGSEWLRISVPLPRARCVAQDKDGRGLPAGCRSFLVATVDIA